MPVDVEVIIVSYHSADFVEQAIASVTEHVPHGRVAVREHGSDPDQVSRLRSICATARVPTRFEHDVQNPGFGAGCNAMALTSTADWLLFLNPDARIVRWPWTDDSPDRGIIGPLVDGPGGPAAHYGTHYRIRDEIARSWMRRRFGEPSGHGFVSGAAMLVPADAFAAVGGFDERYFMFYEDIDLCDRLNKSGVPTWVEHRFHVFHSRGHSTGSRLSQALRWSYESACRFHGDRRRPVWAYRGYVIVDSCLRALFHLASGRTTTAAAYSAVARRAAGDLLFRRRSVLPETV